MGLLDMPPNVLELINRWAPLQLPELCKHFSDLRPQGGRISLRRPVERWLLEGAPVEAWTRQQRMEALRLAAQSGDAAYLDSMLRIVNLVPDSSVLAAASGAGTFDVAYEMLVLPMVHADPLCVPIHTGMLHDALEAAVKAGQTASYEKLLEASEEACPKFDYGWSASRIIHQAAQTGNVEFTRNLLQNLWWKSMYGIMNRATIEPWYLRHGLFFSPLTVPQLVDLESSLFNEEDRVLPHPLEEPLDVMAAALAMVKGVGSSSALVLSAACSASPDWEVKLDATLSFTSGPNHAAFPNMTRTDNDVVCALIAAAEMADGEARVQRLLPLINANNYRPLHKAMEAAAKAGRWPTLRLLLDHTGESASHQCIVGAAAHGRMEVLEHLLALQKPCNICTLRDAFRSAARYGQLNAFRLLQHAAREAHGSDDAVWMEHLIGNAALGGNPVIVSEVAAVYAANCWPVPPECIGTAITTGSVTSVRHLLAACSSFEGECWQSAVRHGDLLMLRALRDTPVGASWQTAAGLDYLKVDMIAYNLAALDWMVNKGGLGSTATAEEWTRALSVFRVYSPEPRWDDYDDMSSPDCVLPIHRDFAFKILSDATARVVAAAAKSSGAYMGTRSRTRKSSGV